MELIRLLHSPIKVPRLPSSRGLSTGILTFIQAIPRFPGGYAFNYQSPSYASVYLETSMHFYGLNFHRTRWFFVSERLFYKGPHTKGTMPRNTEAKTARVAYLAGESRDKPDYLEQSVIVRRLQDNPALGRPISASDMVDFIYSLFQKISKRLTVSHHRIAKYHDLADVLITLAFLECAILVSVFI